MLVQALEVLRVRLCAISWCDTPPLGHLQRGLDLSLLFLLLLRPSPASSLGVPEEVLVAGGGRLAPGRRRAHGVERGHLSRELRLPLCVQLLRLLPGKRVQPRADVALQRSSAGAPAPCGLAGICVHAGRALTAACHRGGVPAVVLEEALAQAKRLADRAGLALLRPLVVQRPAQRLDISGAIGSTGQRHALPPELLQLRQLRNVIVGQTPRSALRRHLTLRFGALGVLSLAACSQ
mmetsp:Transcript_41902/g.121125  ORF Transcript_41902/g.121125 Transcript_41902/m.121125 type:complete len:236 (-) Transcript_41902:9-716(-)